MLLFLNSERAIQANIAIMRIFVKLRGMLSTHKELARKLVRLEQKIEKHDEEIKLIFDAIRQMMTPPAYREKKIGFRVKERIAKYRTSGDRKGQEGGLWKRKGSGRGSRVGPRYPSDLQGK